MAIREEHPIYRRRRGRNLGVLFALLAFVALIFAVTIVKLGPNAANPSTRTSWSGSLTEWIMGKPSQ